MQDSNIACVLQTDIPSIRKWWCLQILEKFPIARYDTFQAVKHWSALQLCYIKSAILLNRHGQNFGQRFAFWTEEAEQLMAGTLPPIYRISRPQIVKVWPN